MKNNIIHILKAGLDKLPKSSFSVTVNYEPIVKGFRRHIINQKYIDFIDEELTKVEKITSFNICLEIRNGAGDEYNDADEPIFVPNWKSVRYTFYGGEEEEEENSNMDLNTVARFTFDRNGDESLNTYTKHWFHEFDYETETSKVFNLFEYSKVNELLDNLIALDTLMDEQYHQKRIIADRLINTAKQLK